ncbi:hypothetical protein DSO57_1024251 [Entomophthora muscae]|uniref:Uncharacterized protein n=1 Tax=Entomophthora muscae TaxID=34485 RepID=A0ACC2UMI9_9FUNG|nr:hypothetical protein DSO57_1024251 [Entomophthora muscae]
MELFAGVGRAGKTWVVGFWSGLGHGRFPLPCTFFANLIGAGRPIAKSLARPDVLAGRARVDEAFLSRELIEGWL